MRGLSRFYENPDRKEDYQLLVALPSVFLCDLCASVFL